MKTLKTQIRQTRLATRRANGTKRNLRPANSQKAEPAIRIQNILVPTDFSEQSRKALRYAVRMAEEFGARLTVLHVVQPLVYPDFAYAAITMENDKLAEAAGARLDLLNKQLEIDPALIRQTLVRTGSPFHEISEAARTLKIDLIVISTHGRSGLTRALIGSTAERVVRHAPCPVLVVREGEREFV